NLAKYLEVPAEVLLGQARLPPADATRVAQELAELLDLEDERFDGCIELAEAALADNRQARGPSQVSTAPLGQALRYLRHTTGRSQVDVAHAAKISTANVVAVERFGILSG